MNETACRQVRADRIVAQPPPNRNSLHFVGHRRPCGPDTIAERHLRAMEPWRRPKSAQIASLNQRPSRRGYLRLPRPAIAAMGTLRSEGRPIEP